MKYINPLLNLVTLASVVFLLASKNNEPENLGNHKQNKRLVSTTSSKPSNSNDLKKLMDRQLEIESSLKNLQLLIEELKNSSIELEATPIKDESEKELANNEQRDPYKDKFSNENYDEAWRDNAENEILKQLENIDSEKFSLYQIECRTKLCKLNVDIHEGAQVSPLELTQLTPWAGKTKISFNDPMHPSEATIFIERENSH